MYEEFYGLTDEPFSITPNPKFLYLSKKHEGGLEHLLYGIERKRGLIVLTGDIGTGKTTLLNTIAQRIDEKTHIAFLVHSQISPLDIYKYIFHEFGINVDISGKTEGDLLILLGDFLVKCANNGENCVLIVDEAQSLSQDVLEQIRLLLNFETYERKLLQIILVGHPHLHEKLNLLESAKLKQRVSISYNLLPLDYAETKGYIEKRLIVAGATRPIYDNDAIAEIYHCSQGIPRLINIVCDLALFLGYAKKQVVLGRDMILQAEQMLQMQETQAPRTLSIEHAREPGVQTPHRHPTVVDESLQNILTPRVGHPSHDVLAPLPWLMDQADPAASSQTPTRGRGYWWLSCGVITVSLALALLFWGGLLQAPANRQQSLDERRPVTSQRFAATPTDQPAATSSAGSTERLSTQLPEPVSATPALPASPPVAPALASLPQGSPTEPTPTEETLGLQKQGRTVSLRLAGLPGAPAAPSETTAIPGIPATPRVVVVQEGDTLGAIILRAYKRIDSRLLTLVQEANPNLANPSRIVIGQQIVLPNLPQ